jgi:hypothetical protein
MKLIVCFLFLSSVTWATENYSYDAQNNVQWESIVERAASNPDVVALYKLRKDLCKQVDNGELSVDEATQIFENERDRIIVDTLMRRKV